MITIDLPINFHIVCGVNIKNDIVKKITTPGVNVAILSNNTESIYQTIDNIVEEIPASVRCLFCDSKINLRKNGITLAEIKTRNPFDDVALEAFTFLSDIVVMGIVDDPVQINLLFLYLLEGYASIIWGLLVKNGENIDQAIQSLLYRMKNCIKFKETTELLTRFALDNIHVCIKIG